MRENGRMDVITESFSLFLRYSIQSHYIESFSPDFEIPRQNFAICFLTGVEMGFHVYVRFVLVGALC